MKQLLLFIAIVLSFAASAQKYQPALLYGKEENRLRVKTNLGIPDSRYAVPDDQKGYPHICREADVTYYWSPASQTWVAESGSGGSGLNNYPTSLGWNSSTGDLTLARSGLSTLTQNIDGRYLTIADAGTYYYDKTTADGRFAPIVHTHVTGDIIGLATYVRNLFSAGSGLLYDAATGQFSYPGSGGGITSLNGLTDGVQTLGVGTSGTDFNISSVGTAHTFNLPTVSGTARGLVTPTLFNNWNAKQGTITLTNVGSSGPATFDGSTLNIPNYIGGVTSVFGRTGAVVATSGDYNSDQITEGSVNQFFTAARARASISVTNTGSGAATYNNTTGVLNIPVTSGADGNNYTTAVGFNAATGDLTIDRSGLSTLSRNLDGRYALLSNAATNENYLAAPGVVTWSGTGLTFDVTPAVYYINGQQYTSNAGSITLDAADPTNPRIDVIAVDNTGAIVKLTGTPAVNPVKPQIDPSTQVELSFIQVDAGATTPSGVSTTVIYNENVEWTLVPQGITIDANNATAFNGTKAISTSAWSNLNQLTFVNGAALQPANYVTFKMYVRLKSTLANNTNITVTLANGSTIVSNEVYATGYGLTKTTVGTYQNISIPFSALNPTGTFDRVRVRFTGSNSNGVYIDYVQLQNGVVPPPPTALQSAYAQMTDGTNTSQSSGADKFKFRSSDATIAATVTNNDATHGDNVNLTVNGANVTGVPQSGVTGLTSALAAKEDAANKSTSTTLGTSNTFFPTQNAVKVYVDNAIASAGGYTDEQAQDAVGAMVSSEFTYTDATPSLAINTIAQSKVTNLVSDLAGKQATLSSGVNIKTVNGNSLLGSGDVTISSGSTYTFGKGLTENSGAVTLGSAPNVIADANYTVSASDYFIKLPTITANRVLTLPSAASFNGRHIVLWSSNTSAFTWTYDVSTIGADGSTTNGGAINNTSIVELVSDGTNWLRQNGSGVTTRSGSGVVGVNQSEIQVQPGTGISIGSSSSGARTTYTISPSGWVGSLSKPGDADVTWNATITDIDYATTLTANRTVTMGTAGSGNNNRKVTIVNSQSAAFNVLLSSTSGVTYKGAAFSTIPAGHSVTLMSDNSTWQVVEYSTASTATGTGDILNGGNTTGANVIVGTNDAHDFKLRANGNDVITIDGTTSSTYANSVLIANTPLTAGSKAFPLILATNTPSGSTVNGSGAAMEFRAATSTTPYTDANSKIGSIYMDWSVVTHATRTSRLQFVGTNNGGAQTYLAIGPSFAGGALSMTMGSFTLSETGFSPSSSNSYFFTHSLNGEGFVFGNSFTSTTLARKSLVLREQYSGAASGSGGLTCLDVSPSINLTGTNTGVQRGINIAPTLTSLGASVKFRAIDMPTDNASYYGIYQSGANSKSVFAGGVTFGATTDPNASAIVDFSSTTKAVLLPRMTKTQRDAIASPVAGMAVYQTDNTPGLRVYNGTNWMKYTETAD